MVVTHIAPYEKKHTTEADRMALVGVVKIIFRKEYEEILREATEEYIRARTNEMCRGKIHT